MRTTANIALQAAAILLFVLLRFAAPGWLFVIYVFTLVGPVLTLVPLGMAVGTVRRGRLTRGVALPFGLTAGLLVLVGAVLPDAGDDRARIPFAELVGHGTVSDGLMSAANTAGLLLLLAYLAALVWTVVAVIGTKDRVRQNSRRSFDSVPRNAS
ncbi:MAG: hypothetical protein OJJ54_17395 [Pseudonocardia sp.]|nr:hypothetical protein [Pseudonocardia sp.]